MLKLQLKRYYKSHGTLIIFSILAVWTGLNFYFIHLDKMEWTLLLGFADVSPYIHHLIDSYQNGIFWFERLVLTIQTSWLSIFWFIAQISFGVMLASHLHRNVEKNYGSLIITRTSYNKYLNTTLLAQAIYISSFILAFMLLTFLLSIIIIGGGFALPYGYLASVLYGRTILGYIWGMFFPIILGILFIVPTILIASVCNFFLRNKYILAFLPFLAYVGVMFFGFLIGDIFFPAAAIAGNLVIDNAIAGYQQSIVRGSGFYWPVFTYPIVAFITFIILYILNKRKFNKEYLA